jgi:hypothetical protein
MKVTWSRLTFEFAQRPPREIAAAVQIVLPRHVGVIHHPLVVAAAFDTAREAARDRPQTMRANARLERHGMAHQAADAAVAVEKRVNVVKPVMGRGDRQDAAAHSERLEAVALFEMRHEGFDSCGRGRLVTPDRDLVILRRAKFSRDHAHPPPGPLDRQHRLGRVRIEGAVQFADERDRSRLRQLAGRIAPVDLPLHADMGARLELQIAPLFRGVELVR